MRSSVALVAALALSGCAKTVWRDEENLLCRAGRCLHVGELGPGWRVVQTEKAQVGFHNDALDSVIQAARACRDDADAAPLDRLTDHLLIGYTEREYVDRRLVPLAGREALRTRVRAKLEGVPVVLDLLVMKKDGCIYDLSYVAPPDTYAGGLSAFERFVRGFRTQGPT